MTACGVVVGEVPTDLCFYFFLRSVLVDLQERSYPAVRLGFLTDSEEGGRDDAAKSVRHLPSLAEAQVERFDMECRVPLLMQHLQHRIGSHHVLLLCVPCRE